MKFKPAWTKEPKAMGLKAAVKPQTGSFVSGVVVVTKEDGTVGTANVRFSDEMDCILGRKMPYGVGPEDKAFLKVFWVGWAYEVRGCYIENTIEVILWNTKELPEWCKRFRPLPITRGEHAQHTNQRLRGTSGRCSDVRSDKRQSYSLQGSGDTAERISRPRM